MFVCECICMCVVSEGALLILCRLLPAGLWRTGGEGWRLDRMDGSCCWLSPGTLAMPTMPYYVAVSGAKLQTVSDWSITNTLLRQAWRDVALHPPLSAGPAGLAGAA